MNNVEEYYNDFYKELSKLDERGNTFSKIETILPDMNGDEKIIDIGCGHGGVSHDLIKKGFKVYGVEINNDAISSLESKGFKVYKKDITKPLKIDERFDVVLILDVLEHVFNPHSLLKEAKNITKLGGCCIVTVPLYFDIVDRCKILFTGSVISMDNHCYGYENYKKFRSYNYDHIRFFRPIDIIEMSKNLGFKIEKIQYGATGYSGSCKLLKYLLKVIVNKYTVNLNPNLFAHTMKIRCRVV